MPRIVIFVNGTLPSPRAARQMLRPDDILLAADGGARFLLQMGLAPHYLIGDLDSLTQGELEQLNTVPVFKYPVDKNETDLELAIQRALEHHPDSILIAAALGGRMDQTLANIFLLADDSLAHTNIRLDDGIEEIFFCRAKSVIYGTIGDTVSLIPWHGDSRGVSTQGLKWKLSNETLFSNKTRGVSNEMMQPIAAVSVRSGLLLVVHRRNTFLETS